MSATTTTGTPVGADYGTFKYLAADYIRGSVCATDTDINALSDNKVITPFMLNKVIMSAGGGGLYPQTANFDSITVNKIAILGDPLGVTDGGTGFADYGVGEILVGDSTAKLSRFAAGSNDQFLVADSSAPLGLTWKTIDIGQRLYFATNSDIDSGSDPNLLISPVTLAYALSNVSAMTAANATISDLTITGTISGVFVANDEELFNFDLSSKAITPASLQSLFDSPPSMGNVVPNDGSFKSLNAEYLNVDNPPWPVLDSVYATDEEAIDKALDNKSLTPSNIPAIMLDPGQIGTAQKVSDGYFSALQCSTLTVTGTPPWPLLDNLYATDVDAVNKTDGNKALTPHNIPAFMAAPGPIGDSSSSTGKFTTLTCDSFTVTGTPPWPTLETSFATTEETQAYTRTDVSVSPARLADAFANPPAIGSLGVNSGAFTTLTATSLTLSDPLSVSGGGTGMSSYTKGDILVGSGSTSLGALHAGSDSQVLVSDSTSPYGVKWTAIGGNVPSATTTSYGTVQLATKTTITEGSSESVLTVNNISDVLTVGSTYGNQTANASYNNLDVYGSVVFHNDILHFGYGGTGQSTYSDGDILVGDNTLGLTKLPMGSEGQVLRVLNNVISWTDHESVLNASTTDVGVVQLATDLDVAAKSSTTKAVTPASLITFAKNPGDIGGGTPGNAVFTDLHVEGGLTLDTAVIPPSNGGTGLTSHSKGSLLVGNGAGLTSLGVGTLGQTLMVDENDTIVWSNTGGIAVATTTQSGVVQLASTTEVQAYTDAGKVITPSTLAGALDKPPVIGQGQPNDAYLANVEISGTFSLLDDIVEIKEGGTGFNTFSESELLVGNTTGGLDKLSSGINGSILTVDAAATNKLDWKMPAYPPQYLRSEPPVVTSSTTAYMPHCFCRSYDDTANISINTSRFFDFTTIGINGINSGPLQSSILGGIVDVTGTQIIGSSTQFLTDFRIGDVFTVAALGSRTVVSIMSDTELYVESAYSSNVTERGYYRGGYAPNAVYYLYAVASPTDNTIVLSNRSMLGSEMPPDIPLTYTALRQLPHSLSTGDNGLLHTVWSGTKGILAPPKIIDVTAAYGSATTILIPGLPNFATTVTLRVTLVSLDPASFIFYWPFTNAELVACEIASGELMETVEVPLDSTQHVTMCYTAGTAYVEVLGYHVRSDFLTFNGPI